MAYICLVIYSVRVYIVSSDFFLQTGITVDGARIYLRESMVAENGAVHVIDRVLLP